MSSDNPTCPGCGSDDRGRRLIPAYSLDGEKLGYKILCRNALHDVPAQPGELEKRETLYYSVLGMLEWCPTFKVAQDTLDSLIAAERFETAEKAVREALEEIERRWLAGREVLFYHFNNALKAANTSRPNVKDGSSLQD